LSCLRGATIGEDYPRRETKYREASTKADSASTGTDVTVSALQVPFHRPKALACWRRCEQRA